LASQFLWDVVAGVLAALPSEPTVKKLEALLPTRLSGIAFSDSSVAMSREICSINFWTRRIFYRGCWINNGYMSVGS
jgi:hypothetical protein